MEPCTMDKSFNRLGVLEDFYSLIWTERYYGDSEVELVVPLTLDFVRKLTTGSFLCIDESPEVMSIETIAIENNQIKVKGISILSWLNNRFIRDSADHTKTHMKIKNRTVGQILGYVVRHMCTKDSDWLYGSKSMGLGIGANGTAREKELSIKGLISDPKNWDGSGKKIVNKNIEYGPVYERLKPIAIQNKVGMRIWLETTPTSYSLNFTSYKGKDRTGTIRFSAEIDSFADLKEVHSIAPQKTLVYAYAPDLEPIEAGAEGPAGNYLMQQNGKPGISRDTPDPLTEAHILDKYTGFDLRAHMIFTSVKNKKDLDNDGEADNGEAANKKELIHVLNDRAEAELKRNERIDTVDGTVAPTNQFKYGSGPGQGDYFLGDVIEVQGLTGMIEKCRVTEYIRTQDASGEVSYPTVEAIKP